MIPSTTNPNQKHNMNDEIRGAADAAQYWPAIRQLFVLALVGAVIGLGELLAKQDKFSWRIAFGRCITSAGLGASTAGALAWMPGLPLVAQCGLAAAMASLGTSGLTLLLQRFYSK